MRENGDNTLTPYEVVCADENVFVIAPVSLNDDNSINSLDNLGFIKIKD